MPSQVVTTRRVKRRQQRLRLVSKNAKRKVRSVRKHRKTAKKVMRGGGYSKTIDFSVQDQISSIIPDIAKEPTLRDNAFKLTIKKHVLFGSGYDITLTVDLDKYPGLVECKAGEGPYGQLPFKYKPIPFMPEFTAANSWKSEDGRETHHVEERSSGREDVNIIINALVNLLFRNNDMTLPKEFLSGRGGEMFKIKTNNVGKRPTFSPYVLLGDDSTRMINKLVIWKNTDAKTAEGKKCVVNMTLKHTDGKIQLVVNNYTELRIEEKAFSKTQFWSIERSNSEKVITEMETSNPTEFFKGVEEKFDALVKPGTPSIFYQGAIIFVMYDSVAKKRVANKLYFTFDDPSEEIASDIFGDKTKFEDVITESLDGCSSFKNIPDVELQTTAENEMQVSTCNALIDPSTPYLEEDLKLNNSDYVKYVLDEVYERLEQDDRAAIDKLRPILDKLRKEQEKKQMELKAERAAAAADNDDGRTAWLYSR